MKLKAIFCLLFLVLGLNANAMTDDQVDEKLGLLRQHYSQKLSAELPEELLKQFEERLRSGESWTDVFADFKAFTHQRGRSARKDCDVTVHEALAKSGATQEQKNFDNKRLVIVNGTVESVWNSNAKAPTSVVDIHCQEGNAMADWSDVSTWGQKSMESCNQKIMLHDFMDKIGLSAEKKHFKNVSLANLSNDSRSPASLSQDKGWSLEIRCHRKKLHFVRLVQP